jgi:hypothetical protein
VIYLGKDVPLERISKMLPVIFSVTSKTPPFSVSTNHVSCFPAGDDGVPIIAKIVSPALHRLRENLIAALEDNDLEYDKKFPEYKPHTTLAYSSDPKTTVDIDIPELTWGAHELVLWGSNRGTGRLVIKFPLSLPQGKVAGPYAEAAAQAVTTYHRATVQLAAWGKKDCFV